MTAFERQVHENLVYRRKTMMETLVRIAGMPCAEFVEEEPDCRARVAEKHWCATCQARAAIYGVKE